MGGTPLLRAVENNNPEIMQALVQYNADMNLADVAGRSPLTAAVQIATLQLLEKFSKQHTDFITMSAFLKNANMADVVAQLKSIGIVSLEQLRNAQEDDYDRIKMPKRRRTYIREKLNVGTHKGIHVDL